MASGALSIMELCRCELERPHKVAAEYVVHESRAWLAARKLDSGLLASDVQKDGVTGHG